MLIINDTHLAPNRTGGTTPASQATLRSYGRCQFQKLLALESNEITINGDMLDGFTIDSIELINVYEICAEWLGEGVRTMNLIQGNHDANPRGDKLSSFHLLCHFLKSHFGDKVRVFDAGYAHVGNNVCCIPHMPNQELFNMEINKAVSEGADGGGYLLLHCNYKNGHAENSDHSLNINDDQVGALMRAGWTLVLGHEHQGYSLRGGRVVVVGNQFPSSVADCIGESRKFALRLMEDGKYESIETWDADGNYVEVDWREDEVPAAKFIRFTGDATASQAADVISKIAKFRQGCGDDILVVTNAVRVEGHDMGGEEAATNVEDIKAFDVIGAILNELTPEEAAVVKGLLK